MNRVSEDEKRGTGFSSEKTLPYGSIETRQAEGRDDCNIELILAIVVTEVIKENNRLRAQQRRTAGARRIASASAGRSASRETLLMESIEQPADGPGFCAHQAANPSHIDAKPEALPVAVGNKVIATARGRGRVMAEQSLNDTDIGSELESTSAPGASQAQSDPDHGKRP